MPEFVACPACGCRVQMAESTIGKAVRCISCNHRFTASAPTEAPTQRMEPLPAREAEPSRTAPPPLPPDFDDRAPQRPDLPRCPRCDRPVQWEAYRCVHCGLELETDPGYGRPRGRGPAPLRRDCEPHRGPLLSGLGNVTLAAGGLTLCVLGLPLLVALPLGIATWVMASNDLAKMHTGEMETQGRSQTENARTSAITGVILSLFFAAGWGLLLLYRMVP